MLELASIAADGFYNHGDERIIIPTVSGRVQFKPVRLKAPVATSIRLSIFLTQVLGVTKFYMAGTRFRYRLSAKTSIFIDWSVVKIVIGATVPANRPAMP